ncbi:MAG: M20/M25/M40 family metallo-hydrolase [Pirellulales bacterium]|nr:M20/M25/M40 family metallo-hydrolase [Pirellulales bacterium]
MPTPKLDFYSRSFFAALIAAVTCWQIGAAEKNITNKSVDATAAESRLTSAVGYLASDELEGRGLGTKGIDRASDYIAEQFHAMGLKTELYDGTPFQKFTVTTSSQLGPKEENVLSLVGPGKRSSKEDHLQLKLGEDFSPLAVGSSAKFSLPLVLVGYGITAPKLGYDDYAGVNAKGKAVVVLRHEPQQNNPHSNFDGTADSPFAPIARKVSNAYEHGAEAVLLVTDEAEIDKRVAADQQRVQQTIDELNKLGVEFQKAVSPTKEGTKQYYQKVAELGEQIRKRADSTVGELDPLLSFTRGGEAAEGRRIPVIHVRRAAIEPAIQAALGIDLATLEKQIDQDAKPRSSELVGWKVVGQTSVERVEAETKNVVAILEGEGPLAEETIVVGAHYDHLGRGTANSRSPGSNEIHNGADDNASGVAALLEVARELAGREKKLPRRIVFVAFTGEERGLLGSAHYVREPVVPLTKTIAMLNMDMVGRLDDDKLIIYGTGTAAEWPDLIDELNEKYAFKITRHPEGFGPSDHSSFYAKEIPVLHFFTGTHKDYHRPTDDVDKINVPGMRRVAEMVAETAVRLAVSDGKPTYQEAKGKPEVAKSGDRPYFGSIPDFSQDQPGYSLMGVSKGSPAEKAGLVSGDIIIGLGDSRIGNLEDFDSALRKFKGGDKVAVTVKRGTEEKKLNATLDPPR